MNRTAATRSAPGALYTCPMHPEIRQRGPLVFVTLDIRHTPAHPVLKWAFIILTLFTGPFGAFFYVLGCREPLRDTHEAYVAVRWRQVLGSTMHCAAGDGLGIITGRPSPPGGICPGGATSAWNTPSVSASDGPFSRRSRCATWRAVPTGALSG